MIIFSRKKRKEKFQQLINGISNDMIIIQQKLMKAKNKIEVLEVTKLIDKLEEKYDGWSNKNKNRYKSYYNTMNSFIIVMKTKALVKLDSVKHYYKDIDYIDKNNK